MGEGLYTRVNQLVSAGICQIVGPPNMFVRSYLWYIGRGVLYSHLALHIQTGIVRVKGQSCMCGVV